MIDEFMVGDLVETFGVRGEVVSITGGFHYPVGVYFDNGHASYFTENGKDLDWHKEPSLKLIERPEKKVKKTFWFASWKDSYSSVRITSCLYLDKTETEVNYQLPEDYQLHSIEIEVDK